jgi:hypothetical protein
LFKFDQNFLNFNIFKKKKVKVYPIALKKKFKKFYRNMRKNFGIKKKNFNLELKNFHKNFVNSLYFNKSADITFFNYSIEDLFFLRFKEAEVV